MPVIRSNIKTGPVFFSDKIAIFSTYEFENNTSNTGILDTFDAFSVDALTLILNFFVILAALIFLTYILVRNSPPRRIRMNGRRFNLRFVPWFIFCFLMKQIPSFPGNRTALKVLLTCCLLTFSYFVTFFYFSMIKTDIVTVKTPRTIASYQDFLDDPLIQPYIRHMLDEYISLKLAEEGSLKRKIWERIVKMDVNRLVYNDGVHIGFMNPQHAFMMYKAVMMAYVSVADAVKYSTAIYLKTFKNVLKRRGLYVSDPTESAKLSASVVNRMTKEDISKTYEIRMRRYFEGHLWHKFMDNTGLQNAKYHADLLGLETDISDFE